MGSQEPAEYHYTINSGPYEGLDHREVLREVIALWERYLDAIDKAAQTP
jgi:hypothetical protein